MSGSGHQGVMSTEGRSLKNPVGGARIEPGEVRRVSKRETTSSSRVRFGGNTAEYTSSSMLQQRGIDADPPRV